ncbi:hypothetical protein [Lentzea sp. NPDC004782]|uniref:hypothetical protein n=1 Tax=Lentzea sp. NPDC004782 TaxID=3154458 RepID=UPI0033A0ECBF
MNVEQILAGLAGQHDSLVEVYVFGTDADDWRRMVERLAEKGFLAGFTRAGEPAPLDVRADVFGGNEDNLLKLRVGAQTWTSMLFVENRIELQGEPREITTPEDLRKLVGLLEVIHDAVGKQVLLMSETMHPEKTKPYLVIG